MDSVDLKAILAQFSSSNPQADSAHAESELAKLQRLTQIQVEKAARNKPQQKEQPPNALLESYGKDLNLPVKDVQRVFDTYRNSDEFRKKIKAIRAHQGEKEQTLLIGRAKMLQDQDFKIRQCETNMIVHITSEPDLQELQIKNAKQTLAYDKAMQNSLNLMVLKQKQFLQRSRIPYFEDLGALEYERQIAVVKLLERLREV